MGTCEPVTDLPVGNWLAFVRRGQLGPRWTTTRSRALGSAVHHKPSAIHAITRLMGPGKGTLFEIELQPPGHTTGASVLVRGRAQ